MAGLNNFLCQVIGLDNLFSKVLSVNRLKGKMFRAYRSMFYLLPGDALITQMFRMNAKDINVLFLNRPVSQFFPRYTGFGQLGSYDSMISQLFFIYGFICELRG